MVSVLVHRLPFEQLSNRFPLSRPEEMGPRFLVEIAIVRGCQKLVQVTAQDLLTRVAEHPLRGRVPVPDLARRVHQDQCVERGVADDSQRLLSGPQFLFVALAVADVSTVDEAAADLALFIEERIRHYFKPEISPVGMTAAIFSAHGHPILDYRRESGYSLFEVIRVNNGEDGLSLQLVGRVPRVAPGMKAQTYS